MVVTLELNTNFFMFDRKKAHFSHLWESGFSFKSPALENFRYH